ncbi:hypothetical protein HDU67_006778 [Dinochytrium kinnereticum]|nr:hypothetical protein HDU67_006778 [Dinochytrium kinnereticum]
MKARSLVLKLYQTYAFPFLRSQKLITSSPSRALTTQDVFTVAFIHALSWFVGSAPPETLKGSMEASSLIQLAVAKGLEGIKTLHVKTSSGADRGAVEGLWISEKVDDVPLGGQDVEKRHVLLYFHGGGYNVNNATSFIDHHARLIKVYNEKSAASGSSRRLVVFSLEYPLAPEHRYPAAIHSSIDALKWLVNEVGVPSITIGGDSAGGNLAINLLNRVNLDASLAACRGKISASMLFSPWVDLSTTTVRQGFESGDYLTDTLSRSWGSNYAGGLSLVDKRVSPLFLGEGEMTVAEKGTFVSYGDIEKLTPAIELFLGKLEKLGTKNLVVHKGEAMPHDFNLVLLLAVGSQGRAKALAAIDDAAKFLLSVE